MYFLYVSKPSDKEYDFDAIVDYCSLALEEFGWEIDEIYADGWVNIPNGVEDMLVDSKTHTKRLKGIAMYTVEDVSMEQIATLGTYAPLRCILAPWIEPNSGPSKNAAKELVGLKAAELYYKAVTSMKIRHGVKASSKRSGAPPFGYRHDDKGNLIPNQDYETLLRIIKLDHANVSVSEIAKKVEMSPAKIYGILKTAKGRDA